MDKGYETAATLSKRPGARCPSDNHADLPVGLVLSELRVGTQPEQVWSHMGAVPVHIHFVVQPVTRALMDELGLHGSRLQVAMFDRRELPEPDEASSFAARARDLL